MTVDTVDQVPTQFCGTGQGTPLAGPAASAASTDSPHSAAPKQLAEHPKLYEGFSELSAIHVGRKGPRTLHIRMQDLVDVLLEELQEKFVHTL